MSSYIEIIKIAVITFPFIAFLISIPFMLIQYHKYGSLSFYKGLIIYSFAFYFICAYFLVILPLPKISEVALLKTPRTQLIPFMFIIDFINHSSLNITNISTYITALKESYFYVPIYNILITIPFGIYLRYYFKCNLKHTIFYTFLLSLFFELTQLSGLYFIYPRGYRLFDADDLLLNTLGGTIGYLIARPAVKALPKLEEIDEEAKERGKRISGLRRTCAMLLDFSIVLVTELFASFFIRSNFMLIYILIAFIYYFIIPIFLKCSTLSEKFLNIKVRDYIKKDNIYRFFLREIIFILIYIGIPFILSYGIGYLGVSENVKEILGVIFLFAVSVLYAITGMKYLFTNKEMLYEKLSKTKLESTIK